jgi:hypothetical protein
LASASKAAAFSDAPCNFRQYSQALKFRVGAPCHGNVFHAQLPRTGLIARMAFPDSTSEGSSIAHNGECKAT